MRDITQTLKQAIHTKTDWKHSVFYQVMARLKNAGIGLSFWDGEENWACIITNDETTGYIWKNHPLIILEHPIILPVKTRLSDLVSICYIETSSLRKARYKASSHDLKMYFDAFNYFDSFTMEELWFETNSI